MAPPVVDAGSLRRDRTASSAEATRLHRPATLQRCNLGIDTGDVRGSRLAGLARWIGLVALIGDTREFALALYPCGIAPKVSNGVTPSRDALRDSA